MISWNCIFGSFKLFPSSKIDFLAIFEIAKMQFGEKYFFFVKLISRVFLDWTFFDYLAHYVFIYFIFSINIKILLENTPDTPKIPWNWFILFHEFFGLDFFKFFGPLCDGGKTFLIFHLIKFSTSITTDAAVYSIIF